jgi:hypothetical protein
VFSKFSKRRIQLVHTFFHSLGIESYDEAIYGSKILYKLKPILGHLNAKFRSVYTPEGAVSVNESLTMWKGRLSWKVGMPSKHARFGIKSFELREAKSGYAWNFIIYFP